MTDNETHIPIPDRPKIRHLVLSGGGGTGFAYYGALRESHKDGFWNINEIESIHGVSGGSAFAFLMVMSKHISWDDLNDYCIKRPWETVFGFSANKILNAYSNVGICGREAIEMVVSPVLSAVDLPLNITMQEFYDFIGIEMHCYTTNLTTYKLIDVSYKTHPNWTLVDAIYSSCALPLLFRPNNINGEIYVDGGFLCNYPLQYCMEQVDNPDEIFGINKLGIVSKPQNQTAISLGGSKTETNDYGNIVDYLLDVIEKTVKKLVVEITQSKYTMEIHDTVTSAWEVYEAVKTKESRTAKIQYGVDTWKEYKNKFAKYRYEVGLEEGGIRGFDKRSAGEIPKESHR
jgi:predicted acylesterase/phospholipase RssA